MAKAAHIKLFLSQKYSKKHSRKKSRWKVASGVDVFSPRFQSLIGKKSMRSCVRNGIVHSKLLKVLGNSVPVQIKDVLE